MELSGFKNTQLVGFAPLVVAKFGLTPTEVPQELFVDELDEGIN